MSITDLAREAVVTASPDTRVPELADLMRERRVGSVVVTEDASPVGLVTDRDVGVRVWSYEDPYDLTAAEVMTEDPVTVAADTGIYDALRRASRAEVRRLPVVEDGELVGIVTLDDFVVLLAGELHGVADVIESESPPY